MPLFSRIQYYFSKKMFSITSNINVIQIRKLQNDCSLYNYEKAIKALNSLQSNAQVLKENVKKTEKEQSTKFNNFNNFIERAGLCLEQVEKLTIIHVAGTKGKGSTCAFTESILRHHGYKTGFFSSPHLIEVVERIRINGAPVDKSIFTKYFWDTLNKLKVNENDGMPIYFQMLTLVAFRIFVEEKVNVAVIEVGIGGEYDCTNILRNVPIVGISSLGKDHTSLLGNTIESIAWHKAGIMKKGCQAFTTAQPSGAMEVLKNRSAEKECELRVVENIGKEGLLNYLKVPFNIYKMNVSLAVELSKAWIKKFDKTKDVSNFINLYETQIGILHCSWPGRFQKLKLGKVNYYLDGAHTVESISHCINWFIDSTRFSQNKRILLFNSTGNRNVADHLPTLQKCYFDKVFFVPNIPSRLNSEDIVNHKSPETDGQLKKCCKHKALWLELTEKNINYIPGNQELYVLPTIHEALLKLNDKNNYDVLITGSLHLVGATLSLIDPELKQSQSCGEGEFITKHCLAL